MKPVMFEGCNAEIAKNQPQFKTLPAMATIGTTFSCWELSQKEIERVLKTKKIWVNQINGGKPMQPICLTSENLLTVSKEGGDCICKNCGDIVTLIKFNPKDYKYWACPTCRHTNEIILRRGKKNKFVSWLIKSLVKFL